MNMDFDKQLEGEIGRELKRLPELTAPVSLADRVMTALEQRASLRWYHRSWQTWPVAIQAVSFLALLCLFGAICFAGWEVSQTEAARFAMRRAGEWGSRISTIGNTFEVLGGAAILVFKKLGVGCMAACLVALGLGYALCVGLGTVYLRLAFVKR
jgi:hypothetical protein